MSVVVADDAEDLARRAASWLAETAQRAAHRCAVCLSGGTTPERLYRMLAAAPLAASFPWAKVHWFFGDERFVSPDDARSNFRMWREALLDHAPVPAANVHPMPTAGEPQEAARAYESELKRFYGADLLDARRPLFDITLLGLGTDGHTASLFPGTAALREATRWVVPVEGAQPEVRLTLTFPVLASSRHVAFLVSGGSKRDILARVRRGEDFPAAAVRPVGALHWFVDRAAAPAQA